MPSGGFGVVWYAGNKRVLEGRISNWDRLRTCRHLLRIWRALASPEKVSDALLGGLGLYCSDRIRLGAWGRGAIFSNTSKDVVSAIAIPGCFFHLGRVYAPIYAHSFSFADRALSTAIVTRRVRVSLQDKTTISRTQMGGGGLILRAVSYCCLWRDKNWAREGNTRPPQPYV